MAIDTVLVRFGEIALKSVPVRRRFIHKLASNIKYFLDKNKIPYQKIREERGRIFVDTKEKEVGKVISKVFGVVSTSPAISTPPKLNKIKKKALKVSKILKNFETFAIRAERAGEDYPFTSKDLEKEIGALVLEKYPHLKVDLENPEKIIYIEVRPKKAYIFTKKIKGEGGLPIGTQGKVLLYLKNENSIAAGWLMMKRGCTLLPVCFDNGKKEEIINNLKKLRNWSNKKFRLNVIPYEKIEEGVKNSEEKILNERIKIRILNKIGKESWIKAIICGKRLEKEGELTKLQHISSISIFPILKPLVGLRKERINQIFKKMKIEPVKRDEMIKSFSIEKIKEEEREMVIERLVEKAFENKKIIEI